MRDYKPIMQKLPKIGDVYTISGHLDSVRIENELLIVLDIIYGRPQEGGYSEYNYDDSGPTPIFVKYFAPNTRKKIYITSLYLFNLSTKIV